MCSAHQLWLFCVALQIMTYNLKRTPLLIRVAAVTFSESKLLSFSLIKRQIIEQTWYLVIINLSLEKGCWREKGRERWEQNERAICLSSLSGEPRKRGGQGATGWFIGSGADTRPNVICSYVAFDWPAVWEPINIHSHVPWGLLPTKRACAFISP